MQSSVESSVESLSSSVTRIIDQDSKAGFLLGSKFVQSFHQTHGGFAYTDDHLARERRQIASEM